jgi:hypothetical protein
MTRFLLVVSVLTVLPLGAPADERTVRLSVVPMPAPKPALKHLLLPEVREMSPGNPVQWYIRCFQEQRNFFFGKEATSDRARFRSMPLSELPVKDLRNYGGHALQQADWGARLDCPDWAILQRVQEGDTSLRMPELEPLRILGWALQVRFRGAVAERRFDDATRVAKTMFALARHLGMCPAGAANRLGMYVADLALDSLEEMIQQPGSPNLYWALTDLPCPLVDLRKGLQGDGVLAAADLRLLRDDAPMTEAQVEALVSRLSGTIGILREQAGRPPRNLRAQIRAWVKDPEKVSAARDRLVDAGSAKDLVKKLPPAQLLLLDQKLALGVQRDERMKLLALAPWQIALLADKEPRKGGGLFADLIPDVLVGRRAQGRLEQRVALLRHVEALRLYAAAHDGKLPAKLSDCGVPLPDDPFTGKPFRYEADGPTAHLRAGPLPDAAKSPGGNVHFQITIRNPEARSGR